MGASGFDLVIGDGCAWRRRNLARAVLSVVACFVLAVPCFPSFPGDFGLMVHIMCRLVHADEIRRCGITHIIRFAGFGLPCTLGSPPFDLSEHPDLFADDFCIAPYPFGGVENGFLVELGNYPPELFLFYFPSHVDVPSSAEQHTTHFFRLVQSNRVLTCRISADGIEGFFEVEMFNRSDPRRQEL